MQYIIYDVYTYINIYLSNGSAIQQAMWVQWLKVNQFCSSQMLSPELQSR